MVLCFKGLPLFLALSDAPVKDGGISDGFFSTTVTLPGAPFTTHHLLSPLVAIKGLPTTYWLPCPRIRWFLKSQ